ncbi:MAG: hypothetical protein HOW73_28175 [Polyangiaceae bacterium]|nr:hypothetical protein [Polyangiaceae bacterium]
MVKKSIRVLSALSAVALSLAITNEAAAQPAPQPAPQPGPQPAPQPAPEPAKKPEPAPGSAALSVPENPPSPPAAGAANPAVPPPPLPKTFADEAALALRDSATGEPVAGWHNMFFFRDPDGNFRLSPSGDMQLDFHAFVGPGVSSESTARGGSGLSPRFFVKRLRVGVHGEFLKRWSFLATFDLTQSITNPTGTDETSAAPAGVDPTSATARYRPVEGIDAGVGLRDVWVNYSLCPCLNFQVGQFRPPFSQENRTSDTSTPLMERSISTRSFTVPGQRETGLMLWGDFGDDIFTYELAVVGGDGQNRATVDIAPDFVGRLLVAPLKSIKLIKDARIGVSARHGERDSEAVGYDVVPFSTQQGFVLWNSTYKDSRGNVTHIIPSGAQNIIGGELYFPIGPVDIAGEAYYAAYHTREGIDGFQMTNTERLGTLNGVGLTSWVTWWAFGDQRIGAAVGRQKPPKLNLKKKADLKRGLEVSALFSAILAGYDGNSRGGEDDENTPGSAGNPATDIDIYQFSGALSYWHTRSVRLSFNYSLFMTPGSGSTENLAAVPGNLYGEKDPNAHLLHELGTRVQLAY